MSKPPSPVLVCDPARGTYNRDANLDDGVQDFRDNRASDSEETLFRSRRSSRSPEGPSRRNPLTFGGEEP